MKLVKNIQNIAKKTLEEEAKAIEYLKNFVDHQFEACVLEILNCKGRVVVTGIGKSAIIGNKMVATFNSTGTPSIFMHAADAIHGDLGMIQKEDIVITISNSGNTPEIKVLIPLLKQTGSKIVAMVGNPESYLAQNADYILNTWVEKEADPNNLAPTCSTTACLALGDAVAVCLIELRDFGKHDFAKYHPGGALGKQLYLKVFDLIQKDAPYVYKNATLTEVIVSISSGRLGATVVMEENQVMGVITDGDLRRMLSKTTDIANILASDIMSLNPKTILDEDYAVKALQIMREKNINQLVVVDENQVYKGLLHIQELIKEGIV